MDIQLLMHRYLEGTLDEEGKRQLIGILTHDPDLSGIFVEDLLETGSVIKHARRLAPVPMVRPDVPPRNVVLSPGSAVPRSSYRVLRRGPGPAFIGLVSALVFILGVVAVWTFRGHQTPPPVAQIPAEKIPARIAVLRIKGADAVTVIRKGVESGGTRRMPIHSGDQLLVKSGSPHIHFLSDGTLLNLQPGTQLALVEEADGKQVLLGTGELTAKVAPQPAGKPMRIKTANALIEVLGTTFTTRADADETEVSVLVGSVKLQRISDQVSVRLDQGGQATVSNTGRITSVVRYKAQDAAITKGNVLEHVGVSGGRIVDGIGGFNIGWNVAACAGPYQLNFEVSSYGSPRSMGVFLNGVKIGVLNVNAAEFETHSVPASLVDGTNVIELRDTEGSKELNVEYLDVLYAAPH